MRTAKYQRGEGIWPVIFLLAVIAFVVFNALKLFPVYMEDFSVQSSLESLEADRAAEYRGVLSVREALIKRFEVNDVEVVGKDDVIISRDSDLYVIDVSYEVNIPYISNISLLINFEHTASVKASI